MRLFFYIFALLMLTPGRAFCSQRDGIISSDNINVRSDSTIQSESICRLRKGTKVKVLSEKFDWCKVSLPKGIRAYVWNKYVEVSNNYQAKVLSDNLNLRIKPSLTAHIVGVVQKNNTLHAIGKSGDWYIVDAYPYAWGWINKKFINITESADIPEISEKTSSLDAYNAIAAVTKMVEDKKLDLNILFTKINTKNIPQSSAYLDIIQNIVKPKQRIAYYYFSKQGKITPADINIAKDYLLLENTRSLNGK